MIWAAIPFPISFGNAMKKEVVCNPRYPHTIKIVRISQIQVPIESGEVVDDEDPFATPAPSSPNTKTENVEIVLYEGKGRAYTDTTTTGTDKVDINKRKASIPVRYDVWEAGKKPLDGDTIYSTVGNNTEIGRVRDCEPDNNRSVVYWDFVRV